MNMYYKLDENKKPVPVEMMEWATSQSDLNSRIVKHDKLANGILVSTVFLGLNHQYGEGPPVLFETMIFGGEHDQFQERYCTWDEAVEGHQVALELVLNSDKQTADASDNSGDLP